MKIGRNLDKNTVTHAVVFTLMLFWLSACGGDETASGAAVANATNAVASGKTVGQGGARITISQGDEISLDGNAMYTMQSNVDSAGLLLSVYSYQSDNDFIAISIVNTKGEANPARYDLNNESDFKVLVNRMVGGVQSGGTAESGQVSIFTSDSSSITGSFLFYVNMMTGTDNENATNIGVHGSFEAFEGERTDLPAVLR